MGEASQNYYMGVLEEEYNPGKLLVAEAEGEVVVEEEEVMPTEISLPILPKNYYYYA